MTHFWPSLPTPATDSQIQADPSLKEKTWHLTWMSLAFLANLRPQRQPTRFTGEMWVNFSCQALGTPIPLLRDHAVARTQCACQKFVLDQYGNHVLTCKKIRRTSLSHLQSYPLLARFILNFYVSCGCWLACRQSSTSISLGMKRVSGMNVSRGVGLAHSAIIGMRLALPLHTPQLYALICWYMAPLTP